MQSNTRNTFIKNYKFDYDFGPPWGHCTVTMTSVSGHLTGLEFPPDYKNWEHPPPDALFTAPVHTVVGNVSPRGRHSCMSPTDALIQDKEVIAKNIENEAKYARALFIWTDCDREGEHIGGEIRDCARKGNRQIEVKRAKFSNIERA
jgi:DNA topoisomerase III